MAQRTRHEENHIPPTPQNRLAIVLPDKYKYYTPGGGQRETFLMCETSDQIRLLVFGREMLLGNWQANIKKIFVDGTFTICPPLYHQVTYFIYFVFAGKISLIFPPQGICYTWNCSRLGAPVILLSITC